MLAGYIPVPCLGLLAKLLFSHSHRDCECSATTNRLEFLTDAYFNGVLC